MSIYQCQRCGCSENTALGWYWCADKNEEWFDGFKNGEVVCSACAPTHYKDGEPLKDFNREWHGRFERKYLPHGEFKTNEQGNLEHIETGLIGNEAYKKFARSEPYPKPVTQE